jgi:hypothetical protein
MALELAFDPKLTRKDLIKARTLLSFANSETL